MMHFIPYADAATTPNIIVDGAPAPATRLALSHWPKSGTPRALLADTSAEIVFKYLDTPNVHVDVDAVSNNHFDEDGLVGIFAMTQPALAARWRALLVEIARAGDFGVCRSRNAARITFVVAAYADRSTSPLPRAIFASPYEATVARLYQEMLPVLPRLIAHEEDFQKLWEAEDRSLEESAAYLDGGIITVEPHDDLDLSIVRVPGNVPMPHSMALHTRTPHSRLIVVRGSSVELQYRYEGWVQFTSRRVSLRVDLTGLAAELSAREGARQWIFDGVDQITPRLHHGGATTSIPVDEVVSLMMTALRLGASAWNPYE